MRCLSPDCGAPTTNGLALCDLCQRKAEADLEFLPVYFRNLARWRPGRSGGRSVPGSRVLYDGTTRGPGTGDRISDTLDEVLAALTTWARALTDDRPHFARPLTLADAVLLADLPDDLAEQLTDDPATAALWLCIGLEQHLTSIATTDWCGELVRDLGHHEERLRSLTETAVPGWYAGACKRCEASTYVVPGLTWVTCRACGTTTYARDHLEQILAEARGWVAAPKRIAEAVVALLDTEQSVERLRKRITKWGDRAQIEAVRRRDADGDEVGIRRYRLGDVLDRLETEGATRTTSERITA